ncbi:MAG: hypothetical protein OQK69_08695 [Gammaproteobacteria bacterium]|nr:hypothetical protein [Gammaproteobacteria bacterium]
MSEGQAEREAEILFPEAEITINDEKIIVNEITFIQGLKYGAMVQPMIAALAELFKKNEDPDFEDIAGIFAANNEALLKLMTVCTGKDIKWLESLSDIDGQNLMATVWVVNKDFFTRRVVAKGMTALLKNQKSPPATETSSAP